MSSPFLLPVATLWQRDLVRFWREKARVLGFVGSPLIFWLVIGAGFGDLAFFFPGALTLTVMFSAVFSTMSLIEDRREGFLLSVLVSPARPSAMVLGKVLGSSTLAWLQGLIFLLFLPVTGLRPGLLDLAGLVAALFLVSVAFTLLGFLLAWQMESTQGFHAIMNMVLFPLWMVSGALFPIGKAHGWMQWLMVANPMTYALAMLRRLMENGRTPAEVPSVALSLAVTGVCAVALLGAATWVVRKPRTRSFA